MLKKTRQSDIPVNTLARDLIALAHVLSLLDIAQRQPSSQGMRSSADTQSQLQLYAEYLRKLAAENEPGAIPALLDGYNLAEIVTRQLLEKRMISAISHTSRLKMHPLWRAIQRAIRHSTSSHADVVMKLLTDIQLSRKRYTTKSSRIPLVRRSQRRPSKSGDSSHPPSNRTSSTAALPQTPRSYKSGTR